MTREDILKYVDENYNTMPETPWAKYPTNVVLRHKSNNKWYGLIMNLSGDKVGLMDTDFVDVINLKCDPEMVSVLSAQNGIREAYHMNKKHWITVILNGAVSDDEICNLIDISYDLTR